LRELTVEDLVGVLGLFSKLLSDLQNPVSKSDSIQLHVEDLKRRGFCVVYGAKDA
jgi:hypothetical protein